MIDFTCNDRQSVVAGVRFKQLYGFVISLKLAKKLVFCDLNIAITMYGLVTWLRSYMWL